jgi:hypothetical protein
LRFKLHGIPERYELALQTGSARHKQLACQGR